MNWDFIEEINLAQQGSRGEGFNTLQQGTTSQYITVQSQDKVELSCTSGYNEADMESLSN